jgi:hypothetical protein
LSGCGHLRGAILYGAFLWYRAWIDLPDITNGEIAVDGAGKVLEERVGRPIVAAAALSGGLGAEYLACRLAFPKLLWKCTTRKNQMNSQ